MSRRLRSANRVTDAQGVMLRILHHGEGIPIRSRVGGARLRMIERMKLFGWIDRGNNLTESGHSALTIYKERETKRVYR